MADTCLGITVNLRNVAPSQYLDFNFNSMVEFNGKYIGANTDGVFELEGDVDNVYGIESYFELPMIDLTNAKIRRLYVGGESEGDLRVKIKNDDANERTYVLTPPNKNNKQVEGKVPVGRDGKGRYWTIRVENVRGCKFRVDEIDAAIIPGNRRTHHF